MGFFNKLKSIGSKVLRVGGNIARTIGDIGGKVVDFAGKNAATLGGIAGTGLTLMGLPEFGIPVAAAGQAIGKIANSKPAQNVVRGFQDVGQSALDASNYLRR